MKCDTPTALALGATLAFGSCHLAACDDGSDHGDLTPPLAAATAPAADEATPDPGRLDLDATEARFGAPTVSPGFTPDPTRVQGTTAGGPVDLSTVADGCVGWAAAQPDAIVHAARPFAELGLMAASGVDLTMLAIGPRGEPRCVDDADGAHPVVRDDFLAGPIRIWIGVRERGQVAPFTLGVSELDDSRPASLLP